MSIGIIVLILAALAFFIQSRPSAFTVTRSASINAPPSSVFPHVNELRKWEAWSPWAKLDPNADESFEGPAAGVGAVMKWSGNNKVGQGIMTITESRPSERVGLKLEFLRPFKATNTASFDFRPEGAGKTNVTWRMQGTNNFIGKAMSLVMNCEKMAGGQFEKGLAQMKTVAKSAS